MNTSNLYPTVAVGFLLLTIACYLMVFKELRRAISKTTFSVPKQQRIFNVSLAFLILWVAFIAFWSGTGRMSNFAAFPFNVAPVIIIPLVTILILTFSNGTATILRQVPVTRLIRLQTFRFFVELLLWGLLIAEMLPVQMTFEGRNFDILSGISAPIVVLLVKRKRIGKGGIVVWNLLALGLLINILAVAILSMPTPMRIFQNEPANIVVAYFPISLLPGMLVPLAYGLHFLTFRRLSLRDE